MIGVKIHIINTVVGHKKKMNLQSGSFFFRHNGHTTYRNN